MSWKIFVLLVLCPFGVCGQSVATIRQQIAQVGFSKVGFTHWSYASSCCHGANTDKCNYFVYDVGKEAGAKMPERIFFGLFNRGPVGAGEGGWGEARSLPHWSQVSSPLPGDIVAGHTGTNVYHVGIYVGGGKTVSANNKNIGHNTWPVGYGYQGIKYWRYQG